MTGPDNMDREAVEACAERYQVCPFELSLDAALFSDAVICDYNYAFDPSARLRRFFGDGESHSFLFLIDEAHNLLERGREMYSADLRLSEARAFRRAVRASFPGLWKLMGRVVTAMNRMPDPGEGCIVLEEADVLAGAVTEVFTEMQRILDRERKDDRNGQSDFDPQLKADFLNYYFDLNHFLSMYDNLDTDYVIYLETEKGTESPEALLRGPGEKSESLYGPGGILRSVLGHLPAHPVLQVPAGRAGTGLRDLCPVRVRSGKKRALYRTGCDQPL